MQVGAEWISCPLLVQGGVQSCKLLHTMGVSCRTKKVQQATGCSAALT